MKPRGRPQRVLSEAEVVELRRLANQGWSPSWIAVEMQMEYRTCKRLAKLHGIEMRARGYGPSQTLSAEQLAEVKRRVALGESDATIGAALGCDERVICQTRRRRGWASGDLVQAQRSKAAMQAWPVPALVRQECGHE